MEHFMAAMALSLLAVMLLVGLFLAVIQSLYFGSSRPRRRMPAWLIVAVLIAFLLLPKIDSVYALNRHGGKAQQEA